MSDTHPLPPLSPAAARQVDQTCDRFEAAWKARPRPRLEDYLDTGGEPERSALLRQLLLLDWDYRRRAGDDPRAAAYHARFPSDPALIEAVCRAMSESPASTRADPDGPHARHTPWTGGEEAGRIDNSSPTEAGPGRYELM